MSSMMVFSHVFGELLFLLLLFLFIERLVMVLIKNPSHVIALRFFKTYIQIIVRTIILISSDVAKHNDK